MGNEGKKKYMTHPKIFVVASNKIKLMFPSCGNSDNMDNNNSKVINSQP